MLHTIPVHPIAAAFGLRYVESFGILSIKNFSFSLSTCLILRFSAPLLRYDDMLQVNKKYVNRYTAYTTKILCTALIIINCGKLRNYYMYTCASIHGDAAEIQGIKASQSIARLKL